jgi:hypothetical protein
LLATNAPFVHTFAPVELDVREGRRLLGKRRIKIVSLPGKIIIKKHRENPRIYLCRIQNTERNSKKNQIQEPPPMLSPCIVQHIRREIYLQKGPARKDSQPARKDEQFTETCLLRGFSGNLLESKAIKKGINPCY